MCLPFHLSDLELEVCKQDVDFIHCEQAASLYLLNFAYIRLSREFQESAVPQRIVPDFIPLLGVVVVRFKKEI